MTKLPIILGPTSVGKTEVAVDLKGYLPIEIISADSRQIYKYLTVGTNKPQGSWVNVSNLGNVYIYKNVYYHLVDFIEPDEEYNAGRFYEDASFCIKKILNRGNIPLVVGGTGLYIKTLTDGISILPKRSKEIRENLQQLLNLYGREYLYTLLLKYDPQRAKEIHPNNVQRIIRSLEIIMQTGEPFSKLVKKMPRTKSYNVILVGLYLSRDKLKNNILKRTEWMFKNGIIEETKNLLEKGYSKDIPALTSIGYKWIIKYLNKEIDINTAKDNFIKDTLNYAKRQMVWFKKDERIKWINCDDLSYDEISEKLYNLLIKELAPQFSN
jgi:tRNA dimethylallyltransferase